MVLELAWLERLLFLKKFGQEMILKRALALREGPWELHSAGLEDTGLFAEERWDRTSRHASALSGCYSLLQPETSG